LAVRRVLILVGIACVCLAGREAHALDTRRSLTQFLHTAWTFRDGMPAFINTFAQTPDGYLWLGTASGLYRFDGTRLEPFYQALPKGGVATVATSASGDLWIGTSVGVSRVREGRLTNFPLPGLGRDHFVRHIAFGPKDDVWVAADKVARFDGRESVARFRLRRRELQRQVQRAQRGVCVIGAGNQPSRLMAELPVEREGQGR